MAEKSISDVYRVGPHERTYYLAAEHTDPLLEDVPAGQL